MTRPNIMADISRSDGNSSSFMTTKKKKKKKLVVNQIGLE